MTEKSKRDHREVQEGLERLQREKEGLQRGLERMQSGDYRVATERSQKDCREDTERMKSGTIYSGKEFVISLKL